MYCTPNGATSANGSLQQVNGNDSGPHIAFLRQGCNPGTQVMRKIPGSPTGYFSSPLYQGTTDKNNKKHISTGYIDCTFPEQARYPLPGKGEGPDTFCLAAVVLRHGLDTMSAYTLPPPYPLTQPWNRSPKIDADFGRSRVMRLFWSDPHHHLGGADHAGK
jgi:hypothetical protein